MPNQTDKFKNFNNFINQFRNLFIAGGGLFLIMSLSFFAGIPAVKNSKSVSLFEQINPPAGYAINATYRDIGPKLLEAGAIDFEKFKTLYENSGSPLTEEQIKILTDGSNKKIVINKDNAHFLLNFLWALGLANKNPVLENGPMVQYGVEQIENFASTGGWTLGTKSAGELYSKSSIIVLNSSQQKILEEFAYNSYRPCCDNPTAFPDCNHGIAALALGEIMAGQGASADEIFEALKYFNGFWFPAQYLDLAKYFQVREGKNWQDVDGRLIMGRNYSSGSGWRQIRQWLEQNNAVEKPPSSGGSCGV